MGLCSAVDEWGVKELPEVFQRNLCALAERSRPLAERLLWPVGSGHLRFEGERPYYRFHRDWTALEPDPAAHAANLPGDEVCFLGVGVGDGLDRALREHPRLRVHAWDRDPWMLRQALSRHDWSRAIRAGRLRLYLGVDILDLSGSDLPRVEHPVLGSIYRLESLLLDDKPLAPRVGLCTGKLYVDDLALALRRRGFSVLPLEVKNWSGEELDYAIKRAQPRFLARINYVQGLAEFTHRHGLPLLVWEIDPSTDDPQPARVPTSHLHLFTYRQSNLEKYRAAGFVHVEYLPLAAPLQRRRPLELDAEQRARYGAPVTFVGASQVQAAAALRKRLDQRYARFAGEGALPDFQAQCNELLGIQSRAGGWILPTLFAERFEEFLASQPADDEEPVRLLAEQASSERRRAILASLAEEGIAIYGDKGFADLPGYRGPARHGKELTMIYNAGAIHVDIGRWYQSDIVTMRVFDVLACGGFLIAQRSEALEAELRVGVEVEAWSTPAELRAKVRYYLAHPEKARAIATAGCQAVRARHGFDQRVDHILESLPDGAALPLAG